MTQKRSKEHLLAQKHGKELENYTCANCLKKFSGNHGHHIIPYSEGGEADLQNIITLCPECHRAYHSGELKIDITRF